MTIVEAFGKILRNKRKSAGLSQERLAFMCGLDRTYIGLLERGQRQPSLTTIFVISEKLNIYPSQMIAELEEVTKYKKDE